MSAVSAAEFQTVESLFADSAKGVAVVLCVGRLTCENRPRNDL